VNIPAGKLRPVPAQRSPDNDSLLKIPELTIAWLPLRLEFRHR